MSFFSIESYEDENTKCKFYTKPEPIYNLLSALNQNKLYEDLDHPINEGFTRIAEQDIDPFVACHPDIKPLIFPNEKSTIGAYLIKTGSDKPGYDWLLIDDKISEHSDYEGKSLSECLLIKAQKLMA